MTSTPTFPRFRPLFWLSRTFDRLAFAGHHRPAFLAPRSLRGRIQSVGIALGWMARGNEYDRRTFGQRMRAGAYYWRQAVRP